LVEIGLKLIFLSIMQISQQKKIIVVWSNERLDISDYLPEAFIAPESRWWVGGKVKG
jgi:hypothetical protein